MNERADFETLPDYLQPGLDIVFIGINPGLYSLRRGHYFARSTSRFWPAFSKSKLSQRMRNELKVEKLLPEHDSSLPRFGIGLTDVVSVHLQTHQSLRRRVSPSGCPSCWRNFIAMRRESRAFTVSRPIGLSTISL